MEKAEQCRLLKERMRLRDDDENVAVCLTDRDLLSRQEPALAYGHDSYREVLAMETLGSIHD